MRILWILLALLLSAGLTYLLIISGVDWAWAKFFNQRPFWVYVALPGVFLGMMVPVAMPLFFWWRFRQQRERIFYQLFRQAALALGLAYVLTTLLKVFTNRVDMEPFEALGPVDFSDQFRFGFMNSQSWWESFSEGWPSGHTLVAVAMLMAILPLLRQRPWKSLHVAYVGYVALSVSTAFHWVSDVLAGALLGMTIGLAIPWREAEPPAPAS